MNVIDIDPVAFAIGGLTVRWYGVMVALAVLTVLAAAVLEARRTGISEEQLYGVFLWGVVGGLVMSRVVHVVDHLMSHPGQSIDLLNFAGLGLYGAILGAPLGAFLYTRVNRIPWSSMARVGDAVALGAPLGQAVGRVGCFINGCCHGSPTSVPWAVVYDHPNSFCSLPGVPVHPTQLYFVVWNLVVFAVVFWMRKRPKPDGASALTYVMLYSAGDFVIRFWRMNEPLALGLQQGQLISLGVILAFLPILVTKWRGYLAAQRGEQSDSLEG
jgi:phosphatidylglycerol:prolipoprotein diacylglycerol transferase